MTKEEQLYPADLGKQIAFCEALLSIKDRVEHKIRAELCSEQDILIVDHGEHKRVKARIAVTNHDVVIYISSQAAGPAPTEYTEQCQSCMGTGVANAEGQRCNECKGAGEVKVEIRSDDGAPKHSIQCIKGEIYCLKTECIKANKCLDSETYEKEMKAITEDKGKGAFPSKALTDFLQSEEESIF